MPITALQYFILGIVQGVLEWLPISSSAFIILIMSNFFQITEAEILLRSALFLHLGTFFAALIYFRKDVWELVETAFRYKKTDDSELALFNFLLVSTIVTGLVGILLLIILSFFNSLELTGKTISFFVGFLLLITGIFQIKTSSRPRGLKHEKNLENKDSLILGAVQGLATLPGLSRSGITVSTLLLRKFDDTTALKLSFLMSLPVVLLGNIVLNYQEFAFSNTALFGILSAFIFGLLTIHGLMKLSKKINFGWFVLIFAALMMVSVVF